MIKRLFLLFGLLLMAMSSVVLAQACDSYATASEAYSAGVDAYDAGVLPDAIDATTCAIELESDNAEYWFWRGWYANEIGDRVSALADYDKAIELDPQHQYAWNSRGIIYYYRGEFDLALADYTEAIEHSPDPSVEYFNRSLIHYERGEYQTAIDDLQTALGINAEDKDIYLMLGIVYTRLNDEGQQHFYFAEWINLNTTETFEETLTGSVNGEVYEMVAGRVYRLAFDGTAGQVMSVSAKADADSDVDPLIVILDANGDAVNSDDDSGVNLDAVISNYALPEDGTYTLLVSHAGGGATGDVTLTVDLGAEGGIEITERFATFELFGGEMADVYTTGGDRLNVRSGPGLDFEVVTQLEAGTLVTLFEGPRKVDGLAWWRVGDDAGNTGWAVERVDEEQTLQLALLVGADAVVTTGGDKLNVRTGAGTGNELAFQLDEGVRVTLLEAPQVVDGFRWWKIQTADGQEGWTIDRFDGDRMLIPAMELDG